MSELSYEDIKEILRLHNIWVVGLEGGHRADFSGIDLQKANFSYKDLTGICFKNSDLTKATFEGSNCSHVDFSGANCIGTDFDSSNLRDANLSGVTGLLSPIEFLKNNFECLPSLGYIAYKTFNNTYKAPDTWKIGMNSILTESVNRFPTDTCGSGINVATLDWVKKYYRDGVIWRVLIKWEWLPGVVVPYNTVGKIRCEKVMLLNRVDR